MGPVLRQQHSLLLSPWTEPGLEHDLSAGRHLSSSGFISARTTKADGFDPQSSKCSPAKTFKFHSALKYHQDIMATQNWRETQNQPHSQVTPRALALVFLLLSMDRH